MASESQQNVRVWRETVSIPTYGVGRPDRNPMFLENRVYQGSSGAVYPHPVIDQVDDRKVDQDWDAVFLENRYLKLMILPALGGRLHMALDKTNNYHFVYHNRVIKPALVGLTGPWISGGIEFNWPQHHRPNTYGPVDCTIATNGDGSATVWCSEIDRMRGTKGMHGFTLYPDKAYVEISVRLFNRTSEPQTFLWWANPACAAGDDHQSIFPPDVHAVMDHGKRAVSRFPIATGEYYKVDYSPGTDISRYRNLPVPTSYMAYHSDYDFVGCYDHGKRAGLLHIANHHIAPGKKQWTWGNGDFGRAWDRHLTDEDGPYIELMCGVYTDNQPDFSWLAPGEEKSFKQYFMPYKGVGQVRNATLRAAVGLDVADHVATVRAYTMAEEPGCRARLYRGSAVLLDAPFDGSPSSWFEASCELPAGVTLGDLRVVVVDASGAEIVSWTPPKLDPHDIPEPATAIPRPEAIGTTESLFLAGTHLEQYRHATREPLDYYDEALRRDPTDLRNNIAKGMLLYRRGRFAEAVRCFRAAVATLTRHNPNPYTGEAHYGLGLALRMLGRYDEAFNAFYKASWNEAQRSAAMFELARIAIRRGDLHEAAEYLERCLMLNARHQQAIHLRIVVWDALGRRDDAVAAARAAVEDEPFNVGALYELSRMTKEHGGEFDARMRDDWHNYLELAADYAMAGLYERGVEVLEHCRTRHGGDVQSPLVEYYLADFQTRLGRDADAKQSYARAAAVDPYCCFPNRLTDIGVLSAAMERNPADARAPYYLGNLWYDRRQYDQAIACWEAARELDPSFPTVHRNLGIAYYNKRRDRKAAWQVYTRAFTLDPTDATVLAELDQLTKRLGHDPASRLARLESHLDLVKRVDKLYLEWVTLLNLTGQHDKALRMLLAHKFHPWEGGEGKVPAQYLVAITQLASQAITENHYRNAIDLLQQAEHWPECLGEGKLITARYNNVDYLLGVAYRGLGDEIRAFECFTRASEGISEPASPQYYNDQPPDMIYYQGLALQALGREAAATKRFTSLVDYGKAHWDDEQEIDYFAVSLPDLLVFDNDLTERHQIHCLYMMALGFAGLGDHEAASARFNSILERDPAHLGACIHLVSLKLRVTTDVA